MTEVLAFDIDNIKLGENVKRQIIIQEVSGLEAEMYRLMLRHKVQTRLGNERNIEELEKSMENIQASIDAFKDEYRGFEEKEPEDEPESS